jgi:hypothetical protein
MANYPHFSESNLPWNDYREDRQFSVIAIVILIIFLIVGFSFNAIKLPEISQKKLVDVSPRLAKLILEKEKIKPPPPEKKKIVPEEKKKEPEKRK